MNNPTHGIPTSISVLEQTNTNSVKKTYVVDGGEVDMKDLTVVDMFCCYMDSLYLKTPDCFGCFCNCTCLFIESTSSCCKPHPNPDKMYICHKTDCNMIYPSTCCKCAEQCFCLDCRCAFPTDHDVPCGFGVCGLICCFNFQLVLGCCKTARSLSGEKITLGQTIVMSA